MAKLLFPSMVSIQPFLFRNNLNKQLFLKNGICREWVPELIFHCQILIRKSGKIYITMAILLLNQRATGKVSIVSGWQEPETVMLCFPVKPHT
jgi:hypothetical protein